MAADNSSSYIGRFAPSPSGPLHLGSLSTALASYLQAKANQGRWLLRIEDIDPPRQMRGAMSQIQSCLDSHGLHWDGPVTFQSKRDERYQAVLTALMEQGCVYSCTCNRQRIKALNGHYDGLCRPHKYARDNAALRFINDAPVHVFDDSLLGELSCDPQLASEDFIVRRKDGLWAYQLAVTVDDFEQGITQVVRGSDLIFPTFYQLSLFKALGWTAPSYFHVPVLSTQVGQKLSKQNHAPAVDNATAASNLLTCLTLLGQATPDAGANVEQIVRFAQQHWDPTKISRTQELIL